MKRGDLGRCISNFQGLLDGELTLYKDDLVQVHDVIDKYWLEGMAGGVIGKFPSSVIVEEDVPIHDGNQTLFVAFENFESLQDGDLPLRRGNFVFGTESIDDAWWHGESFGKKGVFPLNYVWKVDMQILEHSTHGEENVNLRGVAKTSLQAQLPDEIDLVEGESVFITHIIDNDWYRGESCGKKGIFSRPFIHIPENECSKEIDEGYGDQSYKDHVTNSMSDGNDLKCDKELAMEPIEKNSLLLSNIGGSDVVIQDFSEEIGLEKNFDASWKDGKVNDDLFSDDYFKLNMPSMYSDNRNNSSNVSNKSFNKSSSVSLDETTSAGLSPLIQKVNSRSTCNTISSEIDKYLESSHGSSASWSTMKELQDIDFSASYTEDNTGIIPYGRAAYSFVAQHQNELSFKKGEVIHLIKHVDSHWTLGKLFSKFGIFPSSYIDIIVDCPFDADSIFENRSDQVRMDNIAMVLHAFESQNKDEISLIAGEMVAVKNLDSANSWVLVENLKGEMGQCPVNHLSFEKSNPAPDPGLDDPSYKTLNDINSKREYIKDDFGSVKKCDVDEALSSAVENLDSQFKHFKVTPRRLKSTPELKDESSDVKCKDSVSNESSSSLIETQLNKNVEANMSDSEKHLVEPNYLKITTIEENVLVEEMIDNHTVDSTENINETCPPASSSPNSIQSHVEKGSVEETLVNKCKIMLECLPDEEDSTTSDQLPRQTSDDKRRRLVDELVTTEHEYIHDLESLIHVVNNAQRRSDADSVDCKTLMGNMTQVVALSKKLLSSLHSVSFNSDDNLLIGNVFIKHGQEICEIYKIYCANHSIAVEPLLNTYKESSVANEFLTHILTELRGHKIHLQNMRAVLIKPVQRVLKYPLFIDRLVGDTSPSHPDFPQLEQAKTSLLNVAKEINDYTKRLSLVSKYRDSHRDSISDMINKVSLRSVAKKSARITTRISATMGIINQTKDLSFDEYRSKFNSILKVADHLHSYVEKVMKSLDLRHQNEMSVIDSVSGCLLDSGKQNMEAFRRMMRDASCKMIPVFISTCEKRVASPLKDLIDMCQVPQRLILKRQDKVLDFDNAQHKLDRNRDPQRTRILEEELSRVKSTYEGLNDQLISDLPILVNHGCSIVEMAYRTFVSARMNLQGHLAKLYLQIAQAGGLAISKSSEILPLFNQHFKDEFSFWKKLSFVPTELIAKSPKLRRISMDRAESARSTLRKSKNIGAIPKVRTISSSDTVAASSHPRVPFVVVEFHHSQPGQCELELELGQVVTLIKDKDPLGNSSRWFVDDGVSQGFFPSNCLRQLPDANGESVRSNHAIGPSANQGPSANIERTRSNRAIEPLADSRHSYPPSVPLNASVDDALPPRYEDLFPSDCVDTQHSSSDVVHNNGVDAEFLKMVKRKAEAEWLNQINDDSIEENAEIEENIYEEIAEKVVPDVVGGRYENVDTLSEQDDPVYEEISPENKESKETNQFYYSLYKFEATEEVQIPLSEGQVVLLLLADAGEWWFVENRQGQRGYVPRQYLRKYQ